MKNRVILLFTILFIISNFILSQTPHSSKISGNVPYFEIENLAKTHAKSDADPNKLGWAAGSFVSSLVLSPLLGGGITTVVAYNTKGNTNVPYNRSFQINEKFGNEGLSYYSSIYSEHIGKLQKKGNGSGALNGALACWALFIVIILNADTY